MTYKKYKNLFFNIYVSFLRKIFKKKTAIIININKLIINEPITIPIGNSQINNKFILSRKFFCPRLETFIANYL